MALELPDVLLLDGAMGSELDRRGVDVTLPLWSARALIDAPDVVREIHADYLRAGAGAITTNTFRTHRRSLAKGGIADQAKILTQRAVELAREARDAVRPDALIFGSVAPLEDCYEPQLAPPPEVAVHEHEAVIEDLLEAGVDAILIETMSARHEAEAAAEAARRLAPGRWMISFCVKPTGPPGHMLLGAPLADVIPEVDDAVAIGVNCTPVEQVGPHVALLRALLKPETRIIAYANIGTPDAERGWRNTAGADPAAYARHACRWRENGASIIGGCCGTTPDTIAAVARALR